jgi:hypothetical protein
MKQLEKLLKEFEYEVSIENGWKVIKVKTTKNKKAKLENQIEMLNDMLINKKQYVILL